MSTAEAREIPSVSMRLNSVILEQMSFERLGKRPGEAEAELEVQFSLATRRPEQDSLHVRLTLRLAHAQVFEGEITYVGTFTQTKDLGQDEDGEEELRFFAAKVVPKILYPYMRETVTSTAVKAGLPALLLPVINFANVFDLDDVELPPVGGAVDGEQDTSTDGV